MRVSLQTKMTTSLACVAGAISGYYAPASWLTGLALGALAGHLKGSSDARRVQQGGDIRWSKREDNAVRREGIENLSRALPRLWTAGISMAACYVSMVQAALPATVTSFLIGGSGAMLGYGLTSYVCLEQVNSWAEQRNHAAVLSILDCL